MEEAIRGSGVADRSFDSEESSEKDKSVAKGSWVKTLIAFAKPCKGKMIASIILAVLNVITAFIPFLCLYRMLALFSESVLTLDALVFWCGLALLSFVVSVLSHSASTVLSHVSAYSILEGIRNRISDKLAKAPLGVVQSLSAGKIKDTVVDRVEVIERPLAHLIPEFLSSLLMPLVVLGMLTAIDWRMTLASLVSVVVGMFVMRLATRNYEEQYNAYMKANAHVNSVIIEYVEGIEVVKAFNQSSTSYQKFADAVTSFKEFTLSWFRDTWKQTSLTFAILPTTLLGVLPVGLLLYLGGDLTAADLALCAVLSLSLVEPLLRVSFYQNEMRSMEYAVNDAQILLDLEELPETDNSQVPTTFAVSYEKVSFTYSGDDHDEVLHDVTLDIREGSTNALVGPSGSGKSTMARLLVRLWDVSHGSIKIGGIDIRDISLEDLARLVSFVAQDNFLFDYTLRENIRLGNLSASDEEVQAAADAAQCGEFLARFDKGLDTPAGEAGRQLSGGERQRIALARAFLKKAPIIVLDEATAFTDPESESKIQESITRLTQGKTLIVIAHRLSTISNSDQIIVMDEGRVVAKGRQEELLETCPLYLGMWESHVGAKAWAVGKAKTRAAGEAKTRVAGEAKTWAAGEAEEVPNV